MEKGILVHDGTLHNTETIKHDGITLPSLKLKVIRYLTRKGKLIKDTYRAWYQSSCQTQNKATTYNVIPTM